MDAMLCARTVQQVRGGHSPPSTSQLQVSGGGADRGCFPGEHSSEIGNARLANRLHRDPTGPIGGAQIYVRDLAAAMQGARAFGSCSDGRKGPFTDDLRATHSHFPPGALRSRSVRFRTYGHSVNFAPP